MSIFNELPENVKNVLRLTRHAEFVTTSAAGVPIDTVCTFFPSEGLKSLDITTGLAYPTKAERARKNPKVGMMVEGPNNGPVVCVAGFAAVRDADLQGNVIRYLAENGNSLRGDVGWPLAQKAVWYWSRILVETTPAKVFWWESPAAMDGAPHILEAPAGTVFPKSDPAPTGDASKAPTWQEASWQTLAKEALGRKAPGHLSVLTDGFPLPIRARNIAHVAEGFTMEIPKGVPWAITGKASLSFQGLETFLGDVTTQGGVTTMRVERSLPILPSMNNAMEIWQPSEENKAKQMARITIEAARRGQSIPTVPLERPEPTAVNKLRMEQSPKGTAPSREAVPDSYGKV
jgi:hypothetical protein